MGQAKTDGHYLNSNYAYLAVSLVVFPAIELREEVCVRVEANTDAVDEENGKPRLGLVRPVPVRDGPCRRDMSRQQGKWSWREYCCKTAQR